MILDALIGISLAIGLGFNALGVIGILRFPDVYTRLHADTKCTTFGSIFIGLAIVLFSMGESFRNPEGSLVTLALHTLVAVAVLAFTNATGAHAIARAAYRRGHKPEQAVCDRMKGTAP